MSYDRSANNKDNLKIYMFFSEINTHICFAEIKLVYLFMSIVLHFGKVILYVFPCWYCRIVWTILRFNYLLARSKCIFLSARETASHAMVAIGRCLLLFLLLSSTNQVFTGFQKYRLYIRQPPLSPKDEPEWFEYKIKETNMFTVDKYQQVRLLCLTRILVI